MYDAQRLDQEQQDEEIQADLGASPDAVIRTTPA